jgi:serine/threonine protein phosphatase PrpC
MSLRGKIDFAELTDTGKVRDHNEDAIGSNPDIGLMVLADGMGGYNAGEVASGIAVQIVTDLAAEAAEREELSSIDSHSGLMRLSIILRDAVARSNKIIYQTAQSQTHCEGMGTTIVACIFFDNKVSIAHVGDSRARSFTTAGTRRPRFLYARRGAALNESQLRDASAGR